jgi:small subunit ribosomal protein S1
LQSDQETKGSTGLEYVGKKIELKVLELNRSRNRAILSERQAVQDQREKNKAELIKELKLDEIRRGIVTGLSTFGAFIDLGGADGLVHISELSWSPVSSPDEILTIGQEIDVKILKVDSVNNKIALSLKQTQPEPWDNIDEQLNVGDIVNGTITKLTDFGAFARVEDLVEGLIHISELAPRIIQHPRDVVSEGDQVRLKVLRIEADRRRLGLSLLQAEEEGY